MAVHVELPMSAFNTEIELPVTVGLGGSLVEAGTLTLDIRGGKVEDFRPSYAAALREIADHIERAGLDDEEVDDAAS
jgi:hypothetical protein